MNGYEILIGLLLADESDLETIRKNRFFQKVKKALIVKRGDRGLANDLREILYRMLVFRSMYSSGKDWNQALEDLLKVEVKLVGKENVNLVFDGFRKAVTAYFDDKKANRSSVEIGIARIESLRGGDPPRNSHPEVRPTRRRRCSEMAQN